MKKKIPDITDIEITPAYGKVGFILRSTFVKGHCTFRIYDPKKKGNFTDYELTNYDLEVRIIDKSAALYKSSEKCILDYTQEALGNTRIHVSNKNRKYKAKKK